MKRLLIVDDERNAREGLAEALRGSYDVCTAASGGEAIRILGEARPAIELVLTDLRMAGQSGIDVVAHCRKMSPSPKCVLMTAYGDIATAVKAMKTGAADFLPKPLDLDVVEVTLKNLCEKNHDPTLASLNEGEKCDILGHSPAMENTLQIVHRVAATDATVLLTGETGVGKELLAKEIHRKSRRSGRPFIAVNGAALPCDTVESALFGHERGAFTDAHRQHIGYFERAGGGTLFLDEVGELPPSIQVKLLRVLETHTFERVGGQQTLSADVRLVAATNAPLEERVRDGLFREDLYYRLAVVPIPVPPLRERTEDIPLLLEHFFQKFPNAPTLSPEVLRTLRRYPWPGNVRELRNFCEAMGVLHPGEVILREHLDGRFLCGGTADAGKFAIPLGDGRTTSPLQRALEAADGNHSHAAKLLGVSRSTFYRMLHRDGEKNS
ncbi:MAG: sigma-54 dependent transcriptional regulator [Puniceicoccales bacterium]|nr:sigma-54 dependent transcriptional regulator [Puniceicoccales bacterium]